MHTFKYGLANALLFFTLCFQILTVQGDESKPAFLRESDVTLEARLRYERADDELQDDADAMTLRGALAWKTGPFVPDSGWSGLLELEHTAVLGNKDYTTGAKDRGTVLIADPASTEVNQLYLAYESPGGMTAKIGRQAISYGDERFVGTVAFRQNHQSFDAASLNYSGFEDWTLSYAYVANVNRIFGDRSDDRPAGLLGDHEQDSHLANLVYEGFSAGLIEGYAYLIDNKDFERASTDTVGLRFNGSVRPDQLTYLYTLEYARQHSDSRNPRSYKTNYWRFMGGLSYKRLSLQLSQERLGSNNNAGFVTPFATLHRYQGWADKFVALTPNEGIEANSVTVAGRWPGFRYRIQYHDFDVSRGSGDIGKEFGLHLQYRLQQKYFIEIKYADYRGQDGASGIGGLDTDTKRLFLTLSATVGDG